MIAADVNLLDPLRPPTWLKIGKPLQASGLPGSWSNDDISSPPGKSLRAKENTTANKGDTSSPAVYGFDIQEKLSAQSPETLKKPDDRTSADRAQPARLSFKQLPMIAVDIISKMTDSGFDKSGANFAFLFPGDSKDPELVMKSLVSSIHLSIDKCENKDSAKSQTIEAITRYTSYDTAIRRLPQHLQARPWCALMAYLKKAIALDLTPAISRFTEQAESSSGIQQHFLAGNAVLLNEQVKKNLRYEHIQRIFNILDRRHETQDPTTGDDIAIAIELPNQIAHQEPAHRTELFNRARNLMSRLSPSDCPYLFDHLAYNLHHLSQEDINSKWLSLTRDYEEFAQATKSRDMYPVNTLFVSSRHLSAAVDNEAADTLYKTARTVLRNSNTEARQEAIESLSKTSEKVPAAFRDRFLALLLNEVEHEPAAKKVPLCLTILDHYTAPQNVSSHRSFGAYLASRPPAQQMEKMKGLLANAKRLAISSDLI